MKMVVRLLMVGLWVLAFACTSAEDTEPSYEALQEVVMDDITLMPNDPDTTVGNCPQCS